MSDLQNALDTLFVGEGQFVLGGRHCSVSAYASVRGRELGRRFSTRNVYVAPQYGKLVECAFDAPDAARAIKITRIE